MVIPDVLLVFIGLVLYFRHPLKLKRVFCEDLIKSASCSTGVFSCPTDIGNGQHCA